MEDIDRELVLKVSEYDNKLKRLYEEHVKLEAVLSGFESRSYLTTGEEVEVKKLKIKKLAGVDKIMSLLQPHRSEVVVQ